MWGKNNTNLQTKEVSHTFSQKALLETYLYVNKIQDIYVCTSIFTDLLLTFKYSKQLTDIKCMIFIPLSFIYRIIKVYFIIFPQK